MCVWGGAPAHSLVAFGDCPGCVAQACPSTVCSRYSGVDLGATSPGLLSYSGLCAIHITSNSEVVAYIDEVVGKSQSFAHVSEY